MKRKEIKGKSSDELSKILSEKRASLSSFRLGQSGSKSKNIREGRVLKRTIARILTEMRAQIN